MSRWFDSPFFIPEAERSLAAIRLSVAITVALWVTFGPFPTFYPEEAELLYQPTGFAALIPPLGHVAFCALRLTVVVGCVGMLARSTSLVATWLTAATFAVLNGYVSGFSSIWNYNAHLNVFLVALSFSPPHGLATKFAKEMQSSIVFFMRMQVAVIYLQAGLAKLVLGGLDWPSRAPYIHLVLQGGWAASWLAQYPRLIEAGGVFVIVMELALPILLMSRRTRWLGVLAAIGLHLLFFAALGISFWHLWVLFPALFLLGFAQGQSPLGRPTSVRKQSI